MTHKQIITEFNEKCHLAVESGGFLRFPLGKDKVVFLDERLMGLYVVSVLEKQEKEIVICAAVKFKDGVIRRCHRHADAIHARAKRVGIDFVVDRVEGFMTSKNRFVDRKEAQRLQKAAGIKSKHKDGYYHDELYSEDLY